jgi:hypothetical protein
MTYSWTSGGGDETYYDLEGLIEGAPYMNTPTKAINHVIGSALFKNSISFLFIIFII